MKREKQGVSLIVLVITIIVMIILAGAVIISLSNSGIINRAEEAVDKSNEKEVQHLATLIWSEEYIDMLESGDIDETTLATNVKTKLAEQGITEDDFVIEVTASGINVQAKSTLGALISDPTVDYGKLVDYEANGVNEWQVFYEDTEHNYVFLIAKKSIYLTGWKHDVNPESLSLTPVSTLAGTNNTLLDLYNIFKLGQEGYELTDVSSSWYVAELIAKYGAYANAQDYGNYVVGAIGGPTIELLGAGYNEKHNVTAITPVLDLGYYDEESYSYYGEFGYFVNSRGTVEVSGLINDGVYLNKNYWLASPAAASIDTGENVMAVSTGKVSWEYSAGWVRPVVCLKSDIPAVATANGYSLVK